MSYRFEDREWLGTRMRVAFLAGTASDIALSIMEPLRPDDSGSEFTMFRMRAESMLNIVISALVWLRDQKGQPISYDAIYRLLDLGVLQSLSVHRFLPAGGAPDCLQGDVPNFPSDIADAIIGYLDELPGADAFNPSTLEKDSLASRIHEMSVMRFTCILMLLNCKVEAA